MQTSNSALSKLLCHYIPSRITIAVFMSAHSGTCAFYTRRVVFKNFSLPAAIEWPQTPSRAAMFWPTTTTQMPPWIKVAITPGSFDRFRIRGYKTGGKN
jgi:hypothetical protein